MTKRSTQRPVAVLLCVASAAVLAAPTLLFPADSPTEPKLGLLAILLAFGKKFLILFLAAGAAITRYAKGFAGRLRGRAQGGSDAEDEPDTKE